MVFLALAWSSISCNRGNGRSCRIGQKLEISKLKFGLPPSVFVHVAILLLLCRSQLPKRAFFINEILWRINWHIGQGSKRLCILFQGFLVRQTLLLRVPLKIFLHWGCRFVLIYTFACYLPQRRHEHMFTNFWVLWISYQGNHEACGWFSLSSRLCVCGCQAELLIFSKFKRIPIFVWNLLMNQLYSSVKP